MTNLTTDTLVAILSAKENKTYTNKELGKLGLRGKKKVLDFSGKEERKVRCAKHNAYSLELDGEKKYVSKQAFNEMTTKFGLNGSVEVVNFTMRKVNTYKLKDGIQEEALNELREQAERLEKVLAKFN